VSYSRCLSASLLKCHIPQDRNLIVPSDWQKLSLIVRILILDVQKPLQSDKVQEYHGGVMCIQQ
jgi:hypothetical protein